ncbi:hypothetical protein, partial [Streptomyces sp. NPDC020362]|uniref:tetratricopeptide repeat protein n=1 Tax=Streptomyces sp. NPDC020362 TaxID=3154486 RepID=UPI0033CBFFDD
MAALATALNLSAEKLLQLRRSAIPHEDPAAANAPGPGRPLSTWDPHDLEVHPAGTTAGVDGSNMRERRALPGYVPRQHDQMLAHAVGDVTSGRSRMVVLVGTSSTGKTRACWEAIQPLAALHWRLWHPFDPGRAQAALEDLHRVGPRTVVWLNEAQHYLGDPTYGERIAAALHHLLSAPERAPVLVLGTLWPEYANRYNALPAPDNTDLHSRTRELLSARRIPVPDAFDKQALATAKSMAEAGDVLLADALSRADGHGRVAQDLAGAPELLRRYEDGSPAARAILEAAMDARRLGVGLRLPQAFLTDAALDYLADSDYQQLSEDWAEAAYADLARLVHGKQAPLSCIRQRPKRRLPGAPMPADVPVATPAGQEFRLADFLEQHGRTQRRAQCPPASFWQAAHTHLTSADDLEQLAQAASRKHRLRWAQHLLQRAADTGSTHALHQLAERRMEAEDWEGAEVLLRRAADMGSVHALHLLALLRWRAGDRAGAEALALQAADAGSTDALLRLAEWRMEAGKRKKAMALALRAADVGSTEALLLLAEWRGNAGDQEGAEALLLRAADAGSTSALHHLAVWRMGDGDLDSARALLGLATDALYPRAEPREQDDAPKKGTDAFAVRATDARDTDALFQLARWRERLGDREGAEAQMRRAAEAGSTDALLRLAEWGAENEDWDGARALLRRAAEAGSTDALLRLADWQERSSEGTLFDALLRQSADADSTNALLRMAAQERMIESTLTEALLRRAADAGSTDALLRLAVLREQAEDWKGADALVLRAAEAGSTDALC